MDAAADEDLHGRNVLSLFINALLCPLLQSFVDFHVPFAVLVVLGALEIFYQSPACVLHFYLIVDELAVATTCTVPGVS